jgi:predicted glycoside hydrolase/deacetylase ChbG (UPF0249 family)
MLLRVSDRHALIITADDYGYRRSYDGGILEAAQAGALDAVSAMVLRKGCDPVPLLETGVEVGLHLELPEWRGDLRHSAGPGDREAAIAALSNQLRRFGKLFGRPPAHLDGHYHCHAAPGLAAAVGRVAREQRLPVRSVTARHRRLLRCQGVPTPDRLVGRLDEDEPALPAEIRAVARGEGELPPGVTEWMVHPGRSDPASGSAYDRGRAEELDLLLRLGLAPALAAARTTHLVALG